MPFDAGQAPLRISSQGHELMVETLQHDTLCIKIRKHFLTKLPHLPFRGKFRVHVFLDPHDSHDESVDICREAIDICRESVDPRSEGVETLTLNIKLGILNIELGIELGTLGFNQGAKLIDFL